MHSDLYNGSGGGKLIELWAFLRGSGWGLNIRLRLDRIDHQPDGLIERQAPYAVRLTVGCPLEPIARSLGSDHEAVQHHTDTMIRVIVVRASDQSIVT